MKKVAILYGGPSREHEVSIASAKNVLENIDRKIFSVTEVYIHKDMLCEIEQRTFPLEEMFSLIKKKEIEVVFPVFHGEWGEDGQLQKELETRGILFIGSGSLASRNALDKNKSAELFSKNGIVTPKSLTIEKNNLSQVELFFPAIVKPIFEGSSVDLFKCRAKEDFENNKEKIFANHEQMLFQELIEGREFTCGIIEKEGSVTALPVTEIILTKGEVFDYEAKYTPGGCEEITPANIDEETRTKIQNTAIACHKILGCRSLSRTDVIAKNDGTIVVLETNTLPGLTKTSFIPAEAKAFGLEMKELINTLIESAHA